jgi:hypothetical protein
LISREDAFRLCGGASFLLGAFCRYPLGSDLRQKRRRAFSVGSLSHGSVPDGRKLAALFSASGLSPSLRFPPTCRVVIPLARKAGKENGAHIATIGQPSYGGTLSDGDNGCNGKNGRRSANRENAARSGNRPHSGGRKLFCIQQNSTCIMRFIE